MGRTTGTGRGRVAVLALTAVCLAYAPIAFTELWPYARPGAPALGEWLLGRTVSPGFVAEAVRDRTGPYGRSLVPLVVHSVLGGLLMLLGPVQLLTAVRRRVRLHRALGVVFAATVYASMAGAAVYLVRTPPERAFSGAAFWVVLAVILVGTVGSLTLGVLAAYRGFPDLHQRWLLLCYGFLMTAPLLRLEWGFLPALYPGLSLQDVNRVAIMHLGALVSFGALLASRALDRRTSVPGLTGTWAPRAAGCSSPTRCRTPSRTPSSPPGPPARAARATAGPARSGACTSPRCSSPPPSRRSWCRSWNGPWAWTGGRPSWPPPASAAGCSPTPPSPSSASASSPVANSCAAGRRRHRP
ncbi:DUF2306 domain-containing protein [Streptomyces sp. NPDC058758]|uniref:DUF2306 domain-containing protein n=1 Tax=Streptomyces sp. NPDC058758 TaxID=3346627 RepID=UPI0036CA0716